MSTKSTPCIAAKTQPRGHAQEPALCILLATYCALCRHRQTECKRGLYKVGSDDIVADDIVADESKGRYAQIRRQNFTFNTRRSVSMNSQYFER